MAITVTDRAAVICCVIFFLKAEHTVMPRTFGKLIAFHNIGIIAEITPRIIGYCSLYAIARIAAKVDSTLVVPKAMCVKDAQRDATKRLSMFFE